MLAPGELEDSTQLPQPGSKYRSSTSSTWTAGPGRLTWASAQPSKAEVSLVRASHRDATISLGLYSRPAVSPTVCCSTLQPAYSLGAVSGPQKKAEVLLISFSQIYAVSGRMASLQDIDL